MRGQLPEKKKRRKKKKMTACFYRNRKIARIKKKKKQTHANLRLHKKKKSNGFWCLYIYTYIGKRSLFVCLFVLLLLLTLFFFFYQWNKTANKTDRELEVLKQPKNERKKKA